MSALRRLADQFAWTSRGSDKCEWVAEVALPARTAVPLARTERFAGELAAASVHSAGVKVRTNFSVAQMTHVLAIPAGNWISNADQGKVADLGAARTSMFPRGTRRLGTA